MFNTLIDFAKAQAVLLTPNRRLASFVEGVIYQNHFQQNRAAMPAKEVLPVNEWLMQSWQAAKDKHFVIESPTLISPLQQQLLFEHVIEKSELGEGILKTHATALQVAKAWNDCVAWEIDFEAQNELFAQTVDTHAFLLWVNAYQKELALREWVDFQGMVNLWLAWLEQGLIELPPQLVWVGFHDLSPQMQRIQQALESHGAILQHCDLALTPQKIQRVEAANPVAELEGVAKWASEIRQATPTASVGVVIPDLSSRRSQVAATFGQYFSEDEINISAPLSLNQYPLIQSALAFLGLLQPMMQSKDLSYCLRSSFLWPQYQTYAHSVDALLQQRIEPFITWQSLNGWLGSDLFKEMNAEAVGWFELIEQIANRVSEFEGKKSVVDWFLLIQDILQQVLWPGFSEACQVENHLLAGWQQVLQEYLKLDALLGEHSFDVTRQHLFRLTQTMSFLPESKTRQVHVLGLLEALGMPFDYLWVVGLNREAWPMEPQPNPFIPIGLQKTLAMPRSSSERELMVAQQMTETFKQSASADVIFSHALLINDEPHGVSQLIAELPLLPEVLGAHDESKPTEKTTLPLEAIQDEVGQQITDLSIVGGTQLLRWQALCPFHAYARYRLQATDFSVHDIGLRPFEKGMMIHEILQQCWQQLKDQRNLLALSENELKEKLSAITQKVLKRWQRKKPTTLQALDEKVTHDSLCELLLAWLNEEKTRPAFKVHDLEQKRLIQMGPVQLQIQIDRIDELENGDKVIIDYKTGRTKMSEWFVERSGDPQLPLYSLMNHPTPLGIAFAEIRWDSLKFQGVAAHKEMLPNVKSIEMLQEKDWDEQKNSWRESLENLTQEYIRGVAKRAPRDGSKTCNQCHLQMLCRVHEAV